jgi:NitT/TauT family transport system permease protein
VATPNASETAVRPTDRAPDDGVTEAAGVTGGLGRARIFVVDHQHGLLGLLAVVVVLGAWQLTASLGLGNIQFTSSPARIVGAAKTYFGSGEAWPDLSVSFQEYGIGIGLAILISVPVGICIGSYRWISGLLNPIVTFLNSTPLIALAPLFIIWFGLGIESKVALVFLGGFVPIVVTTAAGVRAVEQSLVKVPRSFEATQLQMLRTLVLPASVPSILAGIRLAAGFGLVLMIVGELIASTAGLGYMISSAGNTFQTDKLFVGIAITAIAGMIITGILRVVERYFDRWRL